MEAGAACWAANAAPSRSPKLLPETVIAVQNGDAPASGDMVRHQATAVVTRRDTESNNDQKRQHEAAQAERVLPWLARGSLVTTGGSRCTRSATRFTGECDAAGLSKRPVAPPHMLHHVSGAVSDVQLVWVVHIPRRRCRDAGDGAKRDKVTAAL